MIAMESGASTSNIRKSVHGVLAKGNDKVQRNDLAINGYLILMTL